MGLIHSENLAVSPSEFRRLSVRRLEGIIHYLHNITYSVREEDDLDYHKLASELNSIKLAVGQVEYSFEEIAKFLESLSDKVNTIAEEKVK